MAEDMVKKLREELQKIQSEEEKLKARLEVLATRETHFLEVIKYYEEQNEPEPLSLEERADAAESVLREKGRSIHYAELREAIEKRTERKVPGQNPDGNMNATLSTFSTRFSRFPQDGRGYWGLATWRSNGMASPSSALDTVPQTKEGNPLQDDESDDEFAPTSGPTLRAVKG